MARNCCGNAGCSCVMLAGEGIQITGSGTDSDPYEFTATLVDLQNFLRVVDTPTLNLLLTGAGTADNPLELRGFPTVTTTDLLDVDDPSGPSVGETLVWVTSGDTPHFEYQLPPPSPAGAVNVENGLEGVGDVGDPIGIQTSGVWGMGDLAGLGVDSTIGLPIYVDSNGDIRAKPVAGTAWADITGKPTTFTPSAHTHTSSQITDLSTLGNAAKVNGIKISSTATSITPPSSPTTGDLWFFPEGS